MIAKVLQYNFIKCNFSIKFSQTYENLETSKRIASYKLLSYLSRLNLFCQGQYWKDVYSLNKSSEVKPRRSEGNFYQRKNTRFSRIFKE